MAATTSVGIVAVVYGHAYDQWLGEWMRAISMLNSSPDDVLVHRGEKQEGEKWPQARLMNEAIGHMKTDWIWSLNVDDIALPGGLDGIHDVKADVWMAGYARTGKADYIPPAISGWEILGERKNVVPSMSPFRRKMWRRAGGYPLIGHEDWGLWRRMARRGARFERSGRVHCIYREHELQRHRVEDDREAMLAELWRDGAATL